MSRNGTYAHPNRLLNSPLVRFAYAGAVVARTLGPYQLLGLRRKRLSDEEYERKLADLHTRGAQTVYDAVIRLQGLMIKIGQTTGSRPDVFPPQYASVLASTGPRAATAMVRDAAAHREAARPAEQRSLR